MAIRDRVTVITKAGQKLELEVTKQGGAIVVEYPAQRTPWLIATIHDKNDNPTRETMRVAESEIVSVMEDTAPVVTPKKRSAS